MRMSDAAFFASMVLEVVFVVLILILRQRMLGRMRQK